MNLFAKYPWLWSIALDKDGETLLNGYRLAPLLAHRRIMNWTEEAEAAFAEATAELACLGCFPGAVIWRDEMAVAA